MHCQYDSKFSLVSTDMSSVLNFSYKTCILFPVVKYIPPSNITSLVSANCLGILSDCIKFNCLCVYEGPAMLKCLCSDSWKNFGQVKLGLLTRVRISRRHFVYRTFLTET